MSVSASGIPARSDHSAPSVVPHAGPAWITPPGGILVWMVVFLELLTFGIGLAIFVRLRASEPEVFRQGQAGLNTVTALVNTLLLLTGGWRMANALVRLRARDWIGARRETLFAAVLGGGFLVVKGGEYAAKLGHGHGLNHDTFHLLYWFLTGFHFLHVVVAVILLLAMARALGRSERDPELPDHVEGSAIFWHLCDLIWLLLLPVVYLIR